MEKVRAWCGQRSDRGRPKNGTEPFLPAGHAAANRQQRSRDRRTPDNYIMPCYANNVNKACQTMPGARRRGRPRTAWMDNIKTWTGLSVEESLRTTEDRDKWRKYVHGVANARIEDG